jgi:hypothetical protein
VRWLHRPVLRHPTLVAAFEGWNDAGDASTNAVRWLANRFDARRFAALDPEEYFDFTSTRPRVELVDGETRRIVWPEAEFSAAALPGRRDLVLLVGTEPQLRWPSFCRQVVETATTLGVRRSSPSAPCLPRSPTPVPRR